MSDSAHVSDIVPESTGPTPIKTVLSKSAGRVTEGEYSEAEFCKYALLLRDKQMKWTEYAREYKNGNTHVPRATLSRWLYGPMKGKLDERLAGGGRPKKGGVRGKAAAKGESVEGVGPAVAGLLLGADAVGDAVVTGAIEMDSGLLTSPNLEVLKRTGEGVASPRAVKVASLTKLAACTSLVSRAALS